MILERLRGRELVPGRIVAPGHGVLPVPARGVAGEDVADPAPEEVGRRLAHEVEVDEDHLGDRVRGVVDAGLVADGDHVGEAGVHAGEGGHLPERQRPSPVHPLRRVHGAPAPDPDDRAGGQVPDEPLQVGALQALDHDHGRRLGPEIAGQARPRLRVRDHDRRPVPLRQLRAEPAGDASPVRGVEQLTHARGLQPRPGGRSRDRRRPSRRDRMQRECRRPARTARSRRRGPSPCRHPIPP